jgi:1,4-dihydroxy-2-naphthoate octaprenyltransferase
LPHQADTITPSLQIRFLTITLTSIYYGMIFAWSVGITIVMPIKFAQPPYSFATIPLGTAFLAFGIGGVLGKWVSRRKEKEM